MPAEHRITVRTNREGEFETTYRLDGERYYDLIQWSLCGDSGQRIASEHFHTIRVLRASVEGEFVQREILLIDRENSLEVIPGIDDSVNIVQVFIGNMEVWPNGATGQPGRTDTPLKTSVPITPSSADFSPGGWQVQVIFDQEVGDAVQDQSGRYHIRESFNLKAKYEGEHYLIAPDTASPNDTIAVGGEGFAENQAGRIYAFPRPPATAEDRDECPTYRPRVHRIGVDVTAGRDGHVPDTPLPLDDRQFEQTEEWLLCGVDGRGSVTDSHILRIVPTIQSADYNINVLIRQETNRVKIAPDVDPSATQVTAWKLGPETGGNLDRQADGTYRIAPLVEPGTYTLEFTLSDEARVTGIFSVEERGVPIGDRYLTSDATVAGPDETIEIEGRGFQPNQNVRIYAQQLPYDDRLPACLPYNRNPTDPYVSAMTGNDGTIQNVLFPLSDQRFKDTSMDPWWFCAVDGNGDRTEEPLVIGIRRVLQFERPNNQLIPDVPNTVWITPALPTGAVIGEWAIGDQESTRPTPTKIQELRSGFVVTPTQEPGRYTMTARYVGGVLKAEVQITAGTPLTIGTSPDTAQIGDRVTISGSNHEPEQTVTIFLVRPTANGEAPDCRSSTPLGAQTTTATSGGTFGHEYEITEDIFDTAGTWWLCSRDGLGRTTKEPAKLNIEPTVVTKGGRLVRFKWNRASIKPTISNATVMNATLAGQAAEIETDDAAAGTFRIRTTISPGQYTLVVNMSDGSAIGTEIVVAPQGDPPVITLPDHAVFGESITISGTGFEANSDITLTSHVAKDRDQETICGVPDTTGTAATTTERWQGEEIRSDDDGKFTLTGTLDTNVFEHWGWWGMCATDEAGSATEKATITQARPGISIKNEGRVRANQNAELTITPEPRADTYTTKLTLGQREQNFTAAGATITWLNVPEILGNHTLSVTIDDITTEIAVVILSGRKPDETIPADAKECPGLTTIHDSQIPSAQTAMSFKFTIRPAGGLDCHVTGTDHEIGVVVPDATTVMPSEEVVIELQPDYDMGTTQNVSVHVSTYASRFGHQYTARGALVNESSDAGRNHRIIIPPCTAWTDSAGDPAPCVIDHAKEIRIEIDRGIRLPADASKEYATQVKHGGQTIYDIVAVAASIEATPERAPFNGEITLRGDGFTTGEEVEIWGVNTLDDSFSIPEEEDQSEWDCRLIIEHGRMIDSFVTTRDVTFTQTVSATEDNFNKPGHWELCARVRDGARTTRPERVTIDYEAKPTATSYRAGVRSHLRINPAPPEEAGPIGMTIDGTAVEFEARSDVVNFVMPVNASGDVKAVVEFPDDLKAETKLTTRLPNLESTIQNPSREARIGTAIKVEATQIGGQEVCNPELDGTPVEFLVEGDPTTCVGISANQRFKASVRLTGPGGEATSELVKVFNDHRSAELTMTTDQGGVLKQTITLLRPQITVVTGGSRRHRTVLRQYQPVEVKGTAFPKDTATWNSPQVGYRVEGQKEWSTASADGQWQDTFRLKEGAADEREIEFVPTINGHTMPELARRLTLSVTEPELAITPTEVETGTPVTITASNLTGWTAGWWLGITRDGNRGLVLADHETGDAFTGTANGDGEFSETLRFPEYEADEYDEGNAAIITVQLYNSAGEAVPGAVIELTHRRPEPTQERKLPPTVTPIPASPYKPAFVTRTGPTPTPPIRPTVSVTPLPTRPAGWTGGPDQSLPTAVDHSTVLSKADQDGRTIRLEWTPATGSNPPTGYVITRADEENGIGVALDIPHGGTAPIYRDHTVLPGRTYWYYIEAYNEHGPSGFDGTEPAEASTPGRPGRVERLGTRLTGATIVRIGWLAPEQHGPTAGNIQSYVIEIKEPTEQRWTHVTQVSRYIREWVIIDLRHGTDYEIRVAATNPVGQGEWSEILRVTTAGEPVVTSQGIAREPDAATPEPSPEPTTTPRRPATPESTDEDETPRWLIGLIGAIVGVGAVAILVQMRKRRRMKTGRRDPHDAEEEGDLIEVGQADEEVHTLPEPRPEDDEEATEERAQRRLTSETQDDGEELGFDELVERLRQMEQDNQNDNP